MKNKTNKKKIWETPKIKPLNINSTQGGPGAGTEGYSSADTLVS